MKSTIVWLTLFSSLATNTNSIAQEWNPPFQLRNEQRGICFDIPVIIPSERIELIITLCREKSDFLLWVWNNAPWIINERLQQVKTCIPDWPLILTPNPFSPLKNKEEVADLLSKKMKDCLWESES